MAGLIDKIFDRTIPGLAKTLDLTFRRNQAIVSNISNAETPQYRAVEVNFAHELEKAFNNRDASLKQTNPLHLDTLQQGQAHLVPDYSGATKPDGNNVDIDLQMGRLASNSGTYSSATKLLRRKLAFMKMAIREGGR